MGVEKQTDPGRRAATRRPAWMQLNRRSLGFAGVSLLVAGFIAGILFWGGFNWTMAATNTDAFCLGCHEMRRQPFEEYKQTIHYNNRTGLRVTCSDCHVPRPWIPKLKRKLEASRELYSKVIGKLDDPADFERHRAEMAQRVWRRMQADNSLACRNCHVNVLQMVENQKGAARAEHADAVATGQTCIDCHKGIAHQLPETLISPEVIEDMYDF